MIIKTKILSQIQGIVGIYIVKFSKHKQSHIKLSLNAERSQAGLSKFIDPLQGLQIWALALIKYNPS
jgi:hypothetical protein